MTDVLNSFKSLDVFSDLFGIELVELCFLTITSPKTQHFGLGAVSHVDELLVPPPLVNGTNVAAQDDTVVAYLEQRGVSISVEIKVCSCQ